MQFIYNLESLLLELEEYKHCVTDYKTKDTEDKTYLNHILLLNESC